MKKNYLFIIALFFLGTFSSHAQNTDGTEFWVTFGKNYLAHLNSTTRSLQIRIVSKDMHTTGTIYFSQQTPPIPPIEFSIPPRDVYTLWNLSTTQIDAMYNMEMGTSYKSIRIVTDHPVTAYAMNQTNVSTDATNLLPITALGMDYYQISYSPRSGANDAYAVIATEDNTQVWHNGASLPILNTGQVYYRTSSDMTGSHITSDKPVAFFSLNEGVIIPTNSGSGDCLMQQLAPVTTWGYNFFVPVSDLTTPYYTDTKDRVRIVASQNNTKISQEGGIIQNVTGGQTSLNLDAGQWVELEITLLKKGCYIQADQPIGVCAYLTSRDYNNSSFSDPAIAWVPSIEQTASQAMIAPFIPTATSVLNTHKALVITPTETKNDTRVSVSGAPPVALTGGTWRDNADAEMSFYIMPLANNSTTTYHFTNQNGLIVMGYGTGPAESYYYLGYSAMRNLNAYFTANGVHYQDFPEELFCTTEIEFTAELNEVINWKWYINNVEQPLLEDVQTWTHTFTPGDHTIKMWVLFEDGSANTIEGTVAIGAQISFAPMQGGDVIMDGDEEDCYKLGTVISLTAIPNYPEYIFVNWTDEYGFETTSNPYTFTVTGNRHLVANFELNVVTITLSANPQAGGTVFCDKEAEGCEYNVGEDYATVTATPNAPCYYFVNWTDKSGFETTENPYTFLVEGARTLIANFELYTDSIVLIRAPLTGGTIMCNGVVVGSGVPQTHAHCSEVTISATPSKCFSFTGWTDENGVPVSTDPEPPLSYIFTVDGPRTFIAHFVPSQVTVTVDILPELEGGEVSGTVSGTGTFDCGYMHTVTAHPIHPYEFSHWSEYGGYLHSNLEHEFYFDRDVELTAHFKLKEYNLIVYSNNISWGLTDGDDFNIPHGETREVTAYPVTGYKFTHWTDLDGTPVVPPTDNPLTVTVVSDTVLVANFYPYDYKITTMPNPKHAGFTRPLDSTYLFKDTAIVEAEARPPYKFLYWSENKVPLDGVDHVYEFTVTKSRHLVAEFELETFELYLKTNPPAGGSVNGGGNHIPYNTDMPITAEANTYYDFINWTDENDNEISPIPDHVYTVLKSDTLTANFKKKEMTVTVEASPQTGGSVCVEKNGKCSGTVGVFEHEDWTTVRASVFSDYHFLGWTEDGDTVHREVDYSFPVNYSRHLVAHFERNSYAITLEVDPPHAGTATWNPPTGPFFVSGTNIDVVATSADPAFFYFRNWTEKGIVVADGPLYNFDVTKDRHLTAHFDCEHFEITLLSNPTKAGNLKGGGNLPYLTETTIIAIEDECHVFLYWEEADTVYTYDPEFDLTVEGDRTFTAVFEVKTYLVTTVANPTAGGTTYPEEVDVNCGELVTITAIANLGYRFIEWTTEDGTFVSPKPIDQITVTDTLHLIAHFEYVEYTILLSAYPYHCGTADTSGIYPLDYPLTIHALPYPEYKFVEWRDEDNQTVYTKADYPFTVESDRILVAHFADNDELFVTVSSNHPLWGTATVEGVASLEDILYGTEVTIEATPIDDNFVFKNWSEDGIPIDGWGSVKPFPVTRSRALVAHFAPKDCLIILEENPPGAAATLDGGGTYPYGTNTPLAALPKEYYIFENWTEDGVIKHPDPNWDYTVMGSTTLTANFTPKTYTITVLANETGWGWVDGGGEYAYNEWADISAEAHEHYVFLHWMENDEILPAGPEHGFTVTCSRTLMAVFGKKNYYIDLDREPTTGGEVDGAGYYDYGVTATVVAEAYQHYDFIFWLENGKSLTDENPYIFSVDSSRSLTALFAPKVYNISASAEPQSWGTASGGGLYPYNTMVTLTAQAKDGYEFVEWKEDGEWASYESVWDFPATRDRELVAHFKRATYNITLEASPPHGGDVEEEMFGVEYGTPVTVYATENDFFYFTHWSENGHKVCSDKDFPFDVIKSRHLVAHFSSQTFKISLLAIPPDGGSFEGGGDAIPYLSEITIRAIPDGCFEFSHWIVGDTIFTDPDFPWTVTEDRTFVAHFTRKGNLNITTSPEPPEGGMTLGEFTNIPCGDTINVKAYAFPEYNFVNWTLDGKELSTDDDYTFPATASGNMVANFVANKYTITLIADPPEMGAVSGGGNISYGTVHTVKAHPFLGFSLSHWSENDVEVSTEPDYSFTVTRDRILTAHFEKTMITIKAIPNDTVYGYALGSGKYDIEEIVQVRAVVKSGYQFTNWTKDGDIISTSATYEFPAVENLTLVANFYGLDFDTYAATLWDNTFMLNLRLLEDEGYNVTDCNWFKNGIKETQTNTIDAFSYSAGPNFTDLLELEPTYYMFQLVTKNGSLLNSTKKMLAEWQFHNVPMHSPLFVYPNPVFSNAPFKLEGVTIGYPIEVYNQYGVCVSRTMAKNEIETLSLDLPAGIYIIRNEHKTTRITIIK